MANSRKGAVETILVVDDSEIVRNMVVALLEMANFQVLSAHDASSAIELAGETAGKIDLLLSDVEMPKMSGPDLGQILTQTRPDMQVMLMSGGTDEGLLELNYGWTFIQKPFVHSRLIQMINAVLHLPERHNSIRTRFSPAEVRVAGSTVRITNVDTHEAHSATTGTTGTYIFPSVPTGTYVLDAEASGFAREHRPGLALDVNQNARVDFKLRIGSVNDVIEVTADSPLVDTRDVQMGETVDRQRIENLPLNGRNVYVRSRSPGA